MQNPRACETCRYWVREDERMEGVYGTCRRHPPTMGGLVFGSLAFAEFPRTFGDAWCAEYVQEKKR